MKRIKSKWVTPHRVARSLSVPLHEAYRIVRSGSLRTSPIGGSTRVREEDLGRLLESLKGPGGEGGDLVT